MAKIYGLENSTPRRGRWTKNGETRYVESWLEVKLSAEDLPSFLTALNDAPVKCPHYGKAHKGETPETYRALKGPLQFSLTPDTAPAGLSESKIPTIDGEVPTYTYEGDKRADFSVALRDHVPTRRAAGLYKGGGNFEKLIYADQPQGDAFDKAQDLEEAS